METFFQGYVTCAIWSSTDNRDDSGGQPLDENFGEADIRPESLASMRADCDDFASSNREMLDVAREAGTRNRTKTETSRTVRCSRRARS